MKQKRRYYLLVLDTPEEKQLWEKWRGKNLKARLLELIKKDLEEKTKKD